MLSPFVPLLLLQSPPFILLSVIQQKMLSLNPVGNPFFRYSPVQSCLKFQHVLGCFYFHSQIFTLPILVLPLKRSKNTTHFVFMTIDIRTQLINISSLFQKCQQIMNFILNPNPLPIDFQHRKSEGLQYYEWRYKQKLNQQEQRFKKLDLFLRQIQKQQQQENKNNNHQNRIHHDGTFYEYNMLWKKKVEEKIEEQKMLKSMEKAKEEDKSMKKDISKEVKKEIDQHKGPIEGWQHHFENYLKKKSYYETITPQEVTFEPKINDRSRKMTQGMQGKVEDRLIRFGEYLKQRNQEQINKQNSETLNNFSFTHQKYSSNQSDIFYRLYKQSQETNRRKRDALNDDDVHTFHPKINKLSEDVEDRIMKRRKPLYYVKNQLSQVKQTQNIEQKDKKKKGDFEAFMKRNQALLDMRRKMMMALREQVQQKQNLQRSQCTFSPVLNPTSKKITQHCKRQNKKFQQQLLSNIKLCYPSAQPQRSQQGQNQPGIQNIDISKLTVEQNREADETDSLSIYRTSRMYGENESSLRQRQQKDTHRSKKTMKRQEQFDTRITASKNEGKYTQIEKIAQEDRKGEVSNGKTMDKAEWLQIDKNEGNVQQDSIEKMKTTQWQSELSEIETHLQNMLRRAQR